MFDISLKFEKDLVTRHLHDTKCFDDENDDINSIFFEICEIFQGLESIEFCLSGFSKKWRLDLDFDLLDFLVGLDQVIDSLVMKDDFDILLAESGWRLGLVFNRNENIYEIELSDLARSNFCKIVEIVTYKELCAMIYRFRKLFLELSIVVCPNYYHHRWFVRWRGETSKVGKFLDI